MRAPAVTYWRLSEPRRCYLSPGGGHQGRAAGVPRDALAMMLGLQGVSTGLAVITFWTEEPAADTIQQQS